MAQQVLYVNPIQGKDDQKTPSANQPLRTITEALRRSQEATVIRLQAGTYSASSGEKFPLTLPPNCQVMGEPGSDRPRSIISGSGPVQAAVLGAQDVACILLQDAVLQSVTVINAQTQGIGIWMADGFSRLQDVVVADCPQYGGVILDTAVPTIQTSVFEGCGIAGLAFFTQGKGQLEQIICQNNNTGVLVQDSAAPLIQACRLESNRIGLVVTDTAYPVVRHSHLTHNQSYGLQVTGQGLADLGQPQDPANNIVRDNGTADINNLSSRSLIACGNDLLPQRLQGSVQLVASELPDASVIPAALFDQPVGMPPPAPAPVAPEPISGGVSGSRQFTDMQTHWAGPFVDGLAEAGVVAGFQDGTFRPDQEVTRAQFAAFVLASFPNQPWVNSPAQFTDIAPDFWAKDALQQAQRMGFLSGFPDGTMRPNEPLIRIHAIVAVTNGLGLSGGRADDIGIYRDRAQVPSYAVDALATATQRRLVVNYPDALQLRPLEPMTRGEMAALIYQGRVTQGTASAIASPYIVQPDTTQPLFSDISSHWAEAFIRGLADANLVSGLNDGRFAPDAPMDRAQFAALIVNAFQPPAKRAGTAFLDVPADFWAAAAIQTAYRGEFMSGFPDQTFGPDNALVRIQIWVALVNGLDWEDPTVDLNPLGQFVDYTTVPRYALHSTAIALAQQLIANYPDLEKLHPNKVATRADVCVAVYQALVQQQRLPAISSRYVV